MRNKAVIFKANTFAILLTADSVEDLKDIFNKLKDGKNNTRLQDLHQMPFGFYGQFYDKFGVQWIFKYAK